MALLSPGIQLFESSVTPPVTATAASNGVATLGFSTRGPVNKLVKVSSVSEFNEVFGDPIKDFPFAHIMAQSVLGAAADADIYFMRLIDKDNAANAACPVIDFDIKGAKVAIKDNIAADEVGYFMAKWSKREETQSDTKPTKTALLRIAVKNPKYKPNEEVEPEYLVADAKMNFAATGFGPAGAGATNILYVSIADVIASLNTNGFGDYFSFTQANKVNTAEDGTNNAEIGLVLSAKDEMSYKTDPLKIYVGIGNIDAAGNTFVLWGGEAPESSPSESDKVGDDLPTEKNDKTFYGIELRTNSTISEFTKIDDYNHFELSAKYPGESMNGTKVVKTTNTTVNGIKTWTVTVSFGENTVESRSGITPSNFLEEMSKFAYIEVTKETLKDTSWTWKDGTWELGKGELLSNGSHWADSYTDEGGVTYAVVKGKDGFPTVKVDDKEEYSESKAVNLYLAALGNEDFVNTDEFSFSILATPGMENTMVQNAAISVCATRGDAIYLADVPYQLCESKQEIDDVVAWANGNSGFQSSYCAIYYGWFYQTNPYDSGNSIACPASCFLAPKMVTLDQSMGEFYAPAGIARGGLICSDWSYSPDQKDRDKLVGNDNVVNPISYSNTRGVTIMAQKTTDRTTSPLNRVGIRRMTNMIKRNLRSRLVALLFEPNNEVSRAKARSIVDDVMAGLRSSECIESYDINVVSGTGANRNDLNIYLSFAPYGLIEKIYVYLSITDAGVEVTETVA